TVGRQAAPTRARRHLGRRCGRPPRDSGRRGRPRGFSQFLDVATAELRAPVGYTHGERWEPTENALDAIARRVHDAVEGELGDHVLGRSGVESVAAVVEELPVAGRVLGGDR